MPTHLVNLDALLEREDFEAVDTKQQRGTRSQLRLDDLEDNRRTFHLLRKPDFQRTTNNWSPEKIADLIKSFLDGDFIPSLIMWESQASGKLFVIDGAHRLSALAAWVQDDYGDGRRSKEAWAHSAPTEQLRLAKRTRDLVGEEIGTYEHLTWLVTHQDVKVDDVKRLRANRTAASIIETQWVNGTAQTAETSFYKINSGQTEVDSTELGIIKARRKPNAIATRALVQAGSGHKYWGKFAEPTRTEIEKLSKEIYNILFLPILEMPVKTLDVPVAGQPYSAAAFGMVLDLVNLVNNITSAMWLESKGKRKREQSVEPLLEDPDGSATVAFLHEARKAAYLISGENSGSLGLHPVVYFWGSTGVFQPPAFIAAIKFMRQLERKNLLIAFTGVRRLFEDFLVKNKAFVNALIHAKGSRSRPVDSIVSMYDIIFSELKSGERDEQILIQKLQENERLAKAIEDVRSDETRYRKRFSKRARSGAYLRDAIDGALRCAECGARMHAKSMSADHRVRQEDGGDGDPANAQFMHYFCNSGVKEHRVALERRSVEP